MLTTYRKKKKCSRIKKKIEVDYICRTKIIINIYMEKIRDADDEKKNNMDSSYNQYRFIYSSKY